jgi:succinyl-diaminopimelate desuccinylase
MNDLLKNLIRTAPTAQAGELHAARVLADYFREHSIPTELDTWDDTRANVTASIGDDRPDTPTLLFGSHLDVVPASPDRWKTNPFEPVEKDGKVFGRGAVDMLGGLCAAAAAMADMKNEPIKGRVLLAATAGEETDSSGVKRFVQKYRPKIQNPIGILITEPTDLNMMRAHRGILWLNVRTFGKTVHGSMPEKGINAVLKMNALLNRLQEWTIPHTPHPLLGESSVSPNRISGGTATNIVPDECCLEIDIRTLPSQHHEDIIQSLQDLCDEIRQNDPDFKAQISTIRTVGALETPADSPFLKAVCDIAGIEQTNAAGFTTDGPHFKELDTPVLIFGPGDGSLCHKPDEYIEITEMQKARQQYKNIIAHIFE